MCSVKEWHGRSIGQGGGVDSRYKCEAYTAARDTWLKELTTTTVWIFAWSECVALL